MFLRPLVSRWLALSRDLDLDMRHGEPEKHMLVFIYSKMPLFTPQPMTGSNHSSRKNGISQRFAYRGPCTTSNQKSGARKAYRELTVLEASIRASSSTKPCPRPDHAEDRLATVSYTGRRIKGLEAFKALCSSYCCSQPTDALWPDINSLYR